MNRKYVDFDDGEWHSANGKQIVDKYPYVSPYAEVMIAAGNELGYDRVIDFNRGDPLGFGFSQGTIYKARRQSTAKNYLLPASKRPNLHVINYAMASKIEMVGNRAVGVRFVINGTIVAYSRKEVIVSAGAICSP